MAKKYRVTLTADERTMLQALLSAGTAAARTLTHARILLKADQAAGGPAWTDDAIREALDVGLSTIPACANALWRKALRRRCIGARPSTNASGSWMAARKPTSSPWRVALHRRDASTGACACWLTRWWN